MDVCIYYGDAEKYVKSTCMTRYSNMKVKEWLILLVQYATNTIPNTDTDCTRSGSNGGEECKYKHEPALCLSYLKMK
jgi:hypothetical protein